MVQKRPTYIHFTEREKAILLLLADGHSDLDIGNQLEISFKTVNYHVENIKRRLQASNRTHAVALALRRRYIV